MTSPFSNILHNKKKIAALKTQNSLINLEMSYEKVSRSLWSSINFTQYKKFFQIDLSQKYKTQIPRTKWERMSRISNVDQGEWTSKKKYETFGSLKHSTLGFTWVIHSDILNFPVSFIQNFGMNSYFLQIPTSLLKSR